MIIDNGKMMLNPEDVLAVFPSTVETSINSYERGSEVIIRGCNTAIFVNMESAELIEVLEREKSKRSEATHLPKTKPGPKP